MSGVHRAVRLVGASGDGAADRRAGERAALHREDLEGAAQHRQDASQPPAHRTDGLPVADFDVRAQHEAADGINEPDISDHGFLLEVSADDGLPPGGEKLAQTAVASARAGRAPAAVAFAG